MILWLVETEQRSTGLSHVYLGYWIEACDKMSHKTRYRPIELLGDAGWQKLQPVPQRAEHAVAPAANASYFRIGLVALPKLRGLA